MLIDALRERLGRDAASYQLMGEDLGLLSGEDLGAAAAAYEAELARTVPAAGRAAFLAEQRRLLTIGHGWLRRYNTSIHGRIRGYLALGRLCDFEFPWPVVAVLGLCQVLDGLVRWKAYGLVGRLASALDGGKLDELAAGTDDVLLRTNRGIFADSVPPVLTALGAHRLRQRGDAAEAALAEALCAGPPPLLWDEESRALVTELTAALGEPAGEARFRQLAVLTLRQFAREQAIFTYHMGKVLNPSGRSPLLRRLLTAREVQAPVVEDGRLRFRPYRLPAGFRFSDHAARVDHFGRAFVTAVTGSTADYRVAVAYVQERFGGGVTRLPSYPAGGTPVHAPAL